MILAPGTQLLHYRLTDKIGQGGMGVVWRARDTDLDRDVAIKVLPTSFAADPERMARFEREARLLGSLSHPHIAIVHGLHEATVDSEAVRFIAMEFVPGEDLAQRLARGPLPLDETLTIARKIALGIAAAHDKGTIHRDLKPANVRLTPTGEIKVLDFGLARAAETMSGDDVSASPTITSAGSVAGVLLGTAAYMSPEQARGRTVDRRADVWAFGCLLYECLTGQRAFPGETISDILAELIKSEPDWSRLPAATPPSVRRLLRRCLAKDPDDRLRDLGDAALELSETDEPVTAVATEIEPARPAGVSRLLAVGGVIAALAAGLVLGGMLWRGGGGPEVAARIEVHPLAGTVNLPESATIAYGTAALGYDSPMLTISADGRHIVYVGRDGEGSRLYRRDLSTFDPPEPIEGTDGALTACFSPSGSTLTFLTNDRLVRVELNGDGLQTLGDVRFATRVIWAGDRHIYVGDSQGRLMRRFADTGGEPESLGEVPYHGLSDILPDGRSALFHESRYTIQKAQGVVKRVEFETDDRHVVVENAFDARVRGRRIFFIRGNALMAAPFDPERGEVVGDAEILVRDIAVDSIFGQAQYAVSPGGVLAYLPGGDRAVGTIAWVDRDGEKGRLPVEPRVYGVLNLDPGDRRLAVHVGDINDYIWLYDLERMEGRKLSSGTSAGWPIWNSAGDKVTYSEWGEIGRVLEQPVDSREPARVISEAEGRITASSWSPGDRHLAVRATRTQILDSEGRVVSDGFDGSMAQFSPDGRWISYVSEQAGVYETIVRSWPDGDRVYSIQNEGGVEASWTLLGNELIYRLGDRWYAVEYTSGETLTWTPPRLAFEIAFLDTPGKSYALTSDGQRMYTIVQAEEDIEDRIHVVSGR